jgi:hypothetical protein
MGKNTIERTLIYRSKEDSADLLHSKVWKLLLPVYLLVVINYLHTKVVIFRAYYGLEPSYSPASPYISSVRYIPKVTLSPFIFDVSPGWRIEPHRRISLQHDIR